jgi:putative NIF3 family GTP cyclohydrolase 1 type 2
MPTAQDILDYLLANSPWVDPEATVDTVKWGDPSKEVAKAGVCWYPSLDALKEAHAQGCDALVTHEPLFWEHAPYETRWLDTEPGLTKRRCLDETGLVVIRAHDTWDDWPELGIRDSWAKGLGLHERVGEGERNLLGVYAIEPQPLAEFARYCAGKVRALGEDSVRVHGDPERVVSRPALGVGCIAPGEGMVAKGADVLLVCYDGAWYWSHRERCAELGAAVLVFEHGTTEMWGLESLAAHLGVVFPDAAFPYIDAHDKPWTAWAD